MNSLWCLLAHRYIIFMARQVPCHRLPCTKGDESEALPLFLYLFTSSSPPTKITLLSSLPSPSLGTSLSPTFISLPSYERQGLHSASTSSQSTYQYLAWYVSPFLRPTAQFLAPFISLISPHFPDELHETRDGVIVGKGSRLVSGPSKLMLHS